MKKTKLFYAIVFPIIQILTQYSYSQDLSKEEVENAQKEYLELVKNVNKVYRPIFRENLLRFQFNASFDNNSAKEVRERSKYWMSPASADFRPYRVAEVYFSGEVLGLDHVTKDVGALIACHEIGHLLGGVPLRLEANDDGFFTTTEGQADYFSTLKCVRKLWAHDKVKILSRDNDISEVLWNQCQSQFVENQDRYICQRTLIAINELIQTKYYSYDQGHRIHINEADSDVVTSTIIEGYPSDQCRIDTLVSGALCNRKGALSRVDPTQGVCVEENGVTFGARPKCWYRPKSSEELSQKKAESFVEKLRSKIFE